MEEKSIFNDNVLRKIGFMLGWDWMKLGCYLRMESSVLVNIGEIVSIPVAQMPIKMLKRWRETRPTETLEIEVISKALIRIGRRDLSEFIEKNSTSEITIDDITMVNLCGRLIRVWFDLGMCLGLTYDDLTFIKDSTVPRTNELPGIILLEKWRDSIKHQGEDKAVQSILIAVKSIRRYDLVTYIEENTQSAPLDRV